MVRQRRGWFWGFHGVDDDGQAIWLDVDHHQRLGDWLDAMRQVPYLRRVETAGATIGIAHPLADYHTDWTEREEAMRAGAARERNNPHATTIERAPVDQLWSRAAIERENRNASDLPPARPGIGFVLVGHTPGPVPRWIRRNALCIDTGVHIPEHGHLTIAEIQTGEPQLHQFSPRGSERVQASQGRRLRSDRVALITQRIGMKRAGAKVQVRETDVRMALAGEDTLHTRCMALSLRELHEEELRTWIGHGLITREELRRCRTLDPRKHSSEQGSSRAPGAAAQRSEAE